MWQAHILLTSSVLLLSHLASQAFGQRQNQIPFPNPSIEDGEPHRVAIIGAGAGGSSAAFYLAKYHNESTLRRPIEIDIFESRSYIGGRSTTVEALDDPRYPTELGASIFVAVNHILFNFTRDFNLSTRDLFGADTGAKYGVGIWDGSSFLYTAANDNGGGGWGDFFKGIWQNVKLFWKYGLSPVRTKSAKDAVVGNFLKWYDEYFPIASLTNFASAAGLLDYTGITGQAALLKNSVSEKFAREIVQSSTRVNYAQNLNNLHGLETMVCMATDGAMSIHGGNWQIFSHAIKQSAATLHLNTSANSITRTSRNTYTISTTNTTASTKHDSLKEYDTIVLASPFQFSNLTFIPPLLPDLTPEPIDYVSLHVTLFTSPYRPSPKYFNLANQEDVPENIFTTLSEPLPDAGSTPNPPRGADAVGPTGFWSLSTLRTLNPQNDSFDPTLTPESLVRASKRHSNLSSPLSQPQHLYKIFSPTPLSAQFLSSIFEFNYTSTSGSDPITSLPKNQVPWSYAKVWDYSYPYLPPRLEFPPMKIDSVGRARDAEEFNSLDSGEVGVLRPGDSKGVWYTSGVESFISTMETSALMGMNVARVVVNAMRWDE